MSDPSGLVRSVDAVQCVLAAGVKVQRARTHWIARTAFDIVRKRARPLHSRSASIPAILPCGQPWPRGPSLGILTHDRAVANRLAFGQHVVNVASVGIDQDRAWRFLPLVLNDLAPIGGRRIHACWLGQLADCCRSRAVKLASGTVTGELHGRPNIASKMFWAEAVATEVRSVVTVMPVMRMPLTRLKRVWRRTKKAEGPKSHTDDPPSAPL